MLIVSAIFIINSSGQRRTQPSKNLYFKQEKSYMIHRNLKILLFNLPNISQISQTKPPNPLLKKCQPWHNSLMSNGGGAMVQQGGRRCWAGRRGRSGRSETRETLPPPLFGGWNLPPPLLWCGDQPFCWLPQTEVQRCFREKDKSGRGIESVSPLWGPPQLGPGWQEAGSPSAC